jgi:hypothetical protein
MLVVVGALSRLGGEWEANSIKLTLSSFNHSQICHYEWSGVITFQLAGIYYTYFVLAHSYLFFLFYERHDE